MEEEVNKNNLVVGDIIMVEQAWEDEMGNYHDEAAEIKAIDEKGELALEFYEAPEKVKEFLAGTDGYMANDYRKES